MEHIQRKPTSFMTYDASTAGFDVRDVVCTAVESAAAHAKFKQLRLKRTVETLLPSQLHGNSAAISGLLTELVSNAVRLAHRGEICVSAELEDESPAEVTVRFTVSDNGNEVWPELLGEFFEHFVLADGPARHAARGTPPGLANCKRLVDSIGGEMRVETRPGEGSSLSLLVSLLKTASPLSGNVVLH